RDWSSDVCSSDLGARARQALGDVGARGRGLAFGLALAERVEARLARIDVREIEAREVRDRELAEHIVEDGGRVFDRVVALHRALRLEAGEGEGVDIF